MQFLHHLGNWCRLLNPSYLMTSGAGSWRRKEQKARQHDQLYYETGLLSATSDRGLLYGKISSQPTRHG
jgi:hypothetical protein